MDGTLLIDRSRLPSHVGLIMDGNGRWARKRNLIRTQGHKEGLNAAKRVVQTASDLGLRYLTLFTFSTENWKRAVEEVGFLMGLIKDFLVSELDFYRANKIRIRHAGDIEGLPEDIAEEIRKVVADTANFDGLTVILAINYGGRDELARAVRKIVRSGMPAETVDEHAISSMLDNPDVGDPDLVIRTAGERRLSNFLLWESAYAEFHFSDTLWPDWTGEDLIAAIADFQNRDRRFGGVKQ